MALRAKKTELAKKSKAELMQNPLAPLRVAFYSTFRQLQPYYAQLRKAQTNPQSKPQDIDNAKQALTAAADQHFDRAAFDALLQQIQTVVEADHSYDLASFAKECQWAEHAIKTGALPEDELGRKPNLRLKHSPAAQLVWAAALAYISTHPEVQQNWPEENRGDDKWDIASSAIWEDIENSYDMRRELWSHAYHIAENIGRKDTRIRWGLPGSSVALSRQQNAIDVGLVEALTTGIEHVRASVYREIGLSKLETRWTARAQALHTRGEELKSLRESAKQGKGTKPTEDDYIEYSKLVAEFDALMQIEYAAESNNANQFAKERSRTQALGISLNATQTVFDNFGYGPEPAVAQGEPAEIAAQKLFNLQRMIQMCFFEENGLFENTATGWKSVGVHPEWIEEDPNYPDAAGQSSEEAFNHIRAICREIAAAQPRRSGFHDHLKLIETHMDRKNELVMELWERYAKQYVEPLIEQAEEKAKEQLDDPQQNDGQQQDGQQPQNGENSQQRQNDQQHQQQDDDSWPIEGHDDEKQNPGDMDETPPERMQEHDGQQHDEQQQDSQEQNGESQDSDNQQQDGQQQDGQNGEGQEQDSDERGKTIEELLEEMQEQDKAEEEAQAQQQQDGEGQEQDGDGQEQDGQGQDGEGQDGQQGQQGQGSQPGQGGQKGQGQGEGPSEEGGESFDLNNLPLGDWSDYRAMCSRYSGAIRQTERYLQKLKKPHLEENLSKTDHTLVPKGGQVQRFNPQRFRRRQEKLGTQQQVNITDFEDFHNDEEVQKYVQDDVAVVVDFSGSMKSGTFNKCELAVQAACILREAGKRCGVNVDIFAFGDTSGPRVVASADMNDHQVGESIAGLKQGNSWGTALSPAFKGSKEHPGINEVLADTRGKNGNKVVGGTHLIIVSDGDLDHNDTEKALLTLENTLDAVPLLTTDWMIINPSEATQMDEMADKIAVKKIWQRPSIRHVTDPNAMQKGMLEMLFQRIRNGAKRDALYLQQKAKMFEKAKKMMNFDKRASDSWAARTENRNDNKASQTNVRA